MTKIYVDELIAMTAADLSETTGLVIEEKVEKHSLRTITTFSVSNGELYYTVKVNSLREPLTNHIEDKFMMLDEANNWTEIESDHILLF